MPEDLEITDTDNKTTGGLASSNPDEDGRNKEWQDRARVNLERVPDGVHTNVERDFEPENLEENTKDKKSDEPAY